MIRPIQVRIAARDAHNPDEIKRMVAGTHALNPDRIYGFIVKKRSIDARQKNIFYNLTLDVYIDEQPPVPQHPVKPFKQTDVTRGTPVYITGSGPAGLFAALKLIEKGMKPVILERGKPVRERRRDLVSINRHGLVNPNSNYCFGEGGAGTFSDGKLYTRSHKRGNIHHILEALVFFGASSEILVDAHPHIGTNKLPAVIENIRAYILACGGEIHFEHLLCGISVKNDVLHEISFTNLSTSLTQTIGCNRLILASGHSARDVYTMLHQAGLRLEIKPFALGVRIEHPQQLIDEMQYHCSPSGWSEIRQYLPPASYSLVEQAEGRGVYSFCMCPGGIIAPCATGQQQVVTNGWSPSKRNNPFANSGMVVSVNADDFSSFSGAGPLAGMYYQEAVEHQAWIAGGKNQQAPAQRLMDFLHQKNSASLPDCSYPPGIVSYEIDGVLPKLVTGALRKGLQQMQKKIPAYFTNEAVLVATESRTSTPVRIPRDKQTLEHPQVKGLYPCGEGGGYAGGIISAALDGILVAEKI